jgi:hypothetical protein
VIFLENAGICLDLETTSSFQIPYNCDIPLSSYHPTLRNHTLATNKVKVKVKLSLYRAWRPLGLREVEATTFSDIRLTDGGKVVLPTNRIVK